MNHNNRNNKNTKESTDNLVSNPNYQISGIEPNYSFRGVQNLPFDQSSISTSGYSNIVDLSNGVKQQQQFVNNYNNYSPVSTFDNIEKKSGNLENLKNFSQFNIEQGFKSNQPIQLMPDTKNKHETLYDNLNDNLLKESLREYRLNVDSIDRDIELYPDPFNYVIHLGPVTNSGINASVSRTNIKNELKTLGKKNKNIRHTDTPVSQVYSNIEENNQIKDALNNKIFIFDNPNAIKEYTVKLERSFNPYIIKDFQNVSYVKLDCAVVPKYNSICINSSWDFCRKKHHKKNFFKDEYDRIKDYIIMNNRYIPNDRDDYNPLGDRFIQIYIQELRSTRSFGTNSITDKSFILIYDKTLGALYLKLIPYSASKSYKDSLLGNITKLSIQFYDSWGIPLKINTSCIDYEKDQILNTKIVEPGKINLDNYLTNHDDIIKLIKNFNEIIKCFILINYDIENLIPFYSTTNFNPEEHKIKFNHECDDSKTIEINKKIFKITNIYKEFDNFVSDNGFISIIKYTLNNKKVKVSIDEFIDNVIWYDINLDNIENIIENMKALVFNYNNFGFQILDLLKTEIVNIPINKNFQNFLTFLLGIWEDELNTKIDYYK